MLGVLGAWRAPRLLIDLDLGAVKAARVLRADLALRVQRGVRTCAALSRALRAASADGAARRAGAAAGARQCPPERGSSHARVVLGATDAVIDCALGVVVPCVADVCGLSAGDSGGELDGGALYLSNSGADPRAVHGADLETKSTMEDGRWHTLVGASI